MLLHAMILNLRLICTKIDFNFVDQGIGNSIAEWKPCFLVLSGIYIYVLESELSQTYQRCVRCALFLCVAVAFCLLLSYYASCTNIADVSLAGRQVIEVSPASVGGSLFCLAVCVRGTDVQKVNSVSL